jgi:hypothetical protein
MANHILGEPLLELSFDRRQVALTKWGPCGPISEGHGFQAANGEVQRRRFGACKPSANRSQQYRVPMVFQKSSLPRRERSHVNRLPRWHPHPLQRRSIRYRRYNQCAIVLKTDEPSVEQMIDTGRKQKPIISVQAFVVCGIPPRLAVTGPQVRGIVNARNAAESLNRHHPLLEETLASPSGNDRLSFSSGILMSRSTSDSMWCSHSSKSALATVMLLSAWRSPGLRLPQDR